MHSSESLRSSLTRRLIIALIGIGVLVGAGAYFMGSQYANSAYDRALFDDVYVLANQVRNQSGDLDVDLTPEALIWLLADEGDEVLYRVTDLRTTRIIASNGNLGPFPNLELEDDKPRFRTDYLGAKTFRIAYTRHTVAPTNVPVLVEIGETVKKRSAMTSGILIGLIPAMLVVILSAAAMVWRGVGTALAPLQDLERDAKQLSITNLNPLDSKRAPTEVRSLIDAINMMIISVSDSLEAQRRFISNAAHQLKTPIAGLRLQAQLALKAESAHAARSNILEVERSSARLSHLIDQLLTLSRAEAAESHDRVDLVQVARDAIEHQLSKSISKGIDLGFQGGEEPAVVQGNAVLMGELLGNLLDNSLAYSPTGTRVTVAVTANAGCVTLSVADDGPGIPQAERETMFTRFQRPDSSQLDGAGLGLAIVKEIADRYGGETNVSSRPQVNGTIVRIDFDTRGGDGAAL